MSGWRWVTLLLFLYTSNAFRTWVHDEALINVVEQHLQVVLSIEALPLCHILDVYLILERSLLDFRSTSFLRVLDKHSRSYLREAFYKHEPNRHLLLISTISRWTHHRSVQEDNFLPRLDLPISKVVSEHRECWVLLQEAINLGSHGFSHSSVVTLVKRVLYTLDERINRPVISHLKYVMINV